jgi:hypothetical protein
MPLQEECLGNISSVGSAFSNTTFLLQPANATSFPLMAKQMVIYDKYRTEQFYYRLESTSGTSVGSTNTALGSVLLNASYDVTDAVWTNQIDMEDYGRSGRTKQVKEAKPSTSQTFIIDHARARGPGGDGWMYMLPGVGSTQVTPSGTSAHDYTAGIFQIATAGQQAASVVGRLYVGWSGWVKDRKTDSTGSALVGAHIVESANATASAAAPLGTSGGTVRSGSTLATVTTNTTFTLPIVGQFLIAANWTSAPSVAAAPTLTFGSAITRSQIMNDNASTFNAGFNTANATAWYCTFVTVATAGTAAANTITITGLTSMAGATADIFIQQAYSGLTLERRTAPVQMSEVDSLKALLRSCVASSSNIL